MQFNTEKMQSNIDFTVHLRNEKEIWLHRSWKYPSISETE